MNDVPEGSLLELALFNTFAGDADSFLSGGCGLSSPNRTLDAQVVITSSHSAIK